MMSSRFARGSLTFALLSLAACDDTVAPRAESVHYRRIFDLLKCPLYARLEEKELQQGECVDTAVQCIKPRLVPECTLGKTGELAHFDHKGASLRDDCGIDVIYASGHMQRSFWETNVELKDTWVVGDPVRVCRVDAPSRCKIDGSRDEMAVYSVTNLRTNMVYEKGNRNYATCPQNISD